MSLVPLNVRLALLNLKNSDLALDDEAALATLDEEDDDM